MGDWVTYDWPVRGEFACFHVDTSLGEQQGGYEMLLYCAVTPARADAEVFTPSELRRLDKLEARILKAVQPAQYAGYIHMNALRQYYFYVPEAAARDTAEEAAMKERKLSITAGIEDEPDWITYHQLLMPDAAKYQTIFNAQLIERQRTGGDALEKARRITLLVCFPTEEQRYLFHDDAKHVGFALGDTVFLPELDMPHAQTLYAISTLDKPAMDELTTSAIRAALPHGGELLRWTCPRMAKKSPLA